MSDHIPFPSEEAYFSCITNESETDPIFYSFHQTTTETVPLTDSNDPSVGQWYRKRQEVLNLISKIKEQHKQ